MLIAMSVVVAAIGFIMLDAALTGLEPAALFAITVNLKELLVPAGKLTVAPVAAPKTVTELSGAAGSGD